MRTVNSFFALGAALLFVACGSTSAPTAPSAFVRTGSNSAALSFGVLADTRAAESATPVLGRCFSGGGDASCFSAEMIGNSRPGFVGATSARPASAQPAATAAATVPNPPSNGPVISYFIEAGSAPGVVNLASYDTGIATGTATFNGVAAGTYYVHVVASNLCGRSGASNEVQIVVR